MIVLMSKWDRETWWRTAGIAAIVVLGSIVAYGLFVPERTSVAAEPASTNTPSEDAPPEADPVVSIIGDSYTEGSAMNTAGLAWPSLIAERTGWTVDVHAIGGSGYVATNPDREPAGSTFVTRAGDVDPAASVVIFLGSRNDSSGNELSAATVGGINAAMQAAPNAAVVVVGPPWTDSEPSEEILATRDTLRAAAEAAGAAWVDPIDQGWFPTGSGLIGEDGVHPNDAGHARLADLIEPLIAPLVG